MRFIIIKRISWVLSNPLYYIGAILMFIMVYTECRPYFEVQYFQTDAQIEELQEEHGVRSDIMYGYIPTTAAERYELGLDMMKNDLIQVIGEEEQPVNDFISYLKENRFDKDTAVRLINEQYPVLGNPESYIYMANGAVITKKVPAEEANNYIDSALAAEDFGDYFGRKYSDYFGVAIAFYAVIILALCYLPDYKKDIYELLHTKPMAEWKYPLAKALGGGGAIGLAIVAITVIFQIMLMFRGSKMGIPVNTFALWKYVLLCNVPIIFYMATFYLLIAGLFKTPLPAVPLLFLQLVYSNMGVTDVNGVFKYVPRLGSILIRFPENFFETGVDSSLYFNQALLTAAALLIGGLAVLHWQRKRVW